MDLDRSRVAPLEEVQDVLVGEAEDVFASGLDLARADWEEGRVRLGQVPLVADFGVALEEGEGARRF